MYLRVMRKTGLYFKMGSDVSKQSPSKQAKTI